MNQYEHSELRIVATYRNIRSIEDPRFDRIEIGVIRYGASTAAIIDNNTDSTHVAFVHSGSFGADQDPRVPVGIRATLLFRHLDQLRGDAGRPHSHLATTGHQALGDRDVVAVRAGGADALLRAGCEPLRRQ